MYMGRAGVGGGQGEKREREREERRGGREGGRERERKWEGLARRVVLLEGVFAQNNPHVHAQRIQNPSEARMEDMAHPCMPDIEPPGKHAQLHYAIYP